MRKPWQDKQLLESLYLQQKLTLREISELIGVTVAAIFYWFRKFGIERRQFDIGSIARGKQRTEEEKALLSDFAKKRFLAKEDHPMFGHRHTEEARRKMSETKRRKRAERQAGVYSND